MTSTLPDAPAGVRGRSPGSTPSGSVRVRRPSSRHRRLRLLRRRRRAAIRRLALRVAVFGGVGFAVFVAVLVSRVRTDLVVARGAIEDAKSAATAGDVDGAAARIDVAVARTAHAKSLLRNPVFAPFGVVPVVSDQLRGLRTLTSAGADASRGARELASVASLAASGARGARGTNVDGLDIGGLVQRTGSGAGSTHLAAAQRYLSDASARLASVPGGVIGPIKSARRELAADLVQARSQTRTASSLLSLGERLTAPGRTTRLLLLGQDTWELRPSGGFIGSYGVLEITDGRLRLVRYDDATSLPDPSPPLAAPEPLRSSLNHPWTLTGAGWWADFPQSAAAARELFARQGGERVDGVVAMTQQLLEDLLRVTGPVQVPGFAGAVDAGNVSSRILYEVELKRPQDSPRKLFLNRLSHVVFDRLSAVQSSEAPAILRALGAGVRARHVQVWFADPSSQAPIRLAGWDGGMRAPSGSDFLSVVDANLGTDKANESVHRQITYTVSRDRRGRLIGDVVVKTSDAGPRSSVNVRYRSYLRVYTPPGSVFAGDDVERFQTTTMTESGGRMRWFGQDQVVDVGATGVRHYRYVLPSSVIAGGTYRLRVEPQSGTRGDSIVVRVALGGRVTTTHVDPSGGMTTIEAPSGR